MRRWRHRGSGNDSARAGRPRSPGRCKPTIDRTRRHDQRAATEKERSRRGRSLWQFPYAAASITAATPGNTAELWFFWRGRAPTSPGNEHRHRVLPAGTQRRVAFAANSANDPGDASSDRVKSMRGPCICLQRLIRNSDYRLPSRRSRRISEIVVASTPTCCRNASTDDQLRRIITFSGSIVGAVETRWQGALRDRGDEPSRCSSSRARRSSPGALGLLTRWEDRQRASSCRCACVDGSRPPRTRHVEASRPAPDMDRRRRSGAR